MPPAALRASLRAVAAVIAAAGALDPVVSIITFVPRTVVVARLASSDVAGVEESLRARLPAANLQVRSATSRRLPCEPGESCVIVADGSVDVDLPGDLRDPVSLIALGPVAGPNVAIRSVTASTVQHGSAAGVVHVAMNGVGVGGRRTELRVTDGAATIGSAIHEWPADGEAELDIHWWPIAEGPRALHVEAMPFEGEASAIDNALVFGVRVASIRQPVLIVDARPSWASTFVRRALEDDSRFQVEHRVGLGPSLAAGTPGGRLDPRTLAAASVVIAGGLEGLGDDEVTLLDQFVRVRGGTLVLLPDRLPSGRAARLFPGRWTEHLERPASPAGPLLASETLRLAEAAPVDVVLGLVKGSPAIVLSPAGNGRIVVSGAMDAWRYRDADGGAFDRFWRSVVLESAAAGAPLHVDVAHTVVATGSEVPIEVRYYYAPMPTKSSAVPERSITVSATAHCGERPAQTIRLWPKGPVGVFAGTVSIEGTVGCEVTAAVDGGPVATGGIAVTNGTTATVDAVRAKLERYAAGTGGVVAVAGAEAQVAVALASAATGANRPDPIHPMRSPWWLLPFAACLGTEWWLRRRGGLR